MVIIQNNFTLKDFFLRNLSHIKKYCGPIRSYKIAGQPLKDDVGKCVEAALKKYDEQKNVVWISLRWLSAAS